MAVEPLRLLLAPELLELLLAAGMAAIRPLLLSLAQAVVALQNRVRRQLMLLLPEQTGLENQPFMILLPVCSISPDLAFS
jgi:hypothetical protein